MTHSNNPIDVNKHLLVRIGASHQQINILACRSFAALPLWARKRIKALRSAEGSHHEAAMKLHQLAASTAKTPKAEEV